MTSRTHRSALASCAIAGLFLSGTAVYAADFDVSSIYGRASPSNTAVTETTATYGTPEPVQAGTTTSDAISNESESLAGTPLVEGRGMREGLEYIVVNPEPDAAFNVGDVMGRSSPPAPADAPDFGLHG